MKSRLIMILLAVLFAGCVNPEFKAGTPGEYELPGLNNTTIFYANISSVQVVDNVINVTSVRFPIGETGEMTFENPVAVDYSGKNISFNVSKETILGRSYANFDFKYPFSGFVAFSQPDGQDFTRMLTKNGSVRIVLPVNYTTGSRFLGIAYPEPDNITRDASGREVLIWKNPYPEHTSISVKYYDKTAPAMLIYLFVLLILAATMAMGYNYLTLRSLKKKRERMEKGIK
ncbi:MAG: DUF5803 family protein [Candidatus Methanoperedens sp.]|nr:DUF5803 family protein [Candidatus Methanoperedens sp.]